MASDFTDVVAALGRPPDAASIPGRPQRVTVLGAGPEGRALAAWLLAEGTEEVALFTVYSDELAALASGAVTLRGDGPVGTFRVGDGGIAVGSVLDSALAEADVVFVTGPVFKLRTYGMVLGPYIGETQTLVVAPAQTFGGLEVDWWLGAGGRRVPSTMIELTALPFDVRSEDGTLHLGRRRPSVIGVRPAHRGGITEWLSDVLGDVDPQSTVLHASFSDGSGLVDVPSLLLGGPAMGATEASLPPGAVPLAPTAFRRLVTDRTETLIGILAEERRSVAAQFGVLDLPTTQEWIDTVAGGDVPADTRPVPDPDAATALVRQGVLGSLVPLASAGRLAGVATPATTALVETVSAILGADLASAGRTLEGIGFAGGDPDAVRRTVGVGGDPGAVRRSGRVGDDHGR